MSDSLPEAPETEAVHLYFSLSYANFAVLPRTLLQSMSDEWQVRFFELMTEYDEHWRELPDGFLPGAYRVQPVERGRLVPWDNYRLPHYSRGRARVTSEGAITGERFPR